MSDDVKRFKGYDWELYGGAGNAADVLRNCLDCCKSQPTRWRLIGQTWTAKLAECYLFMFRRVYLSGTIFYYAIRYKGDVGWHYRRLYVDCEDAPQELAELLEFILFEQ